MQKSTVYFDLETAGLSDHHPDIQLAAVAVDAEFKELASFEAKLLFDETKADREALELNHYDRGLWARDGVAPLVAVIRFSKFLEGYRDIQMISKRTGAPYGVARLAGHNADRFDGPRLQALFKKHERFLPADPRVRCTCQLAMWFFDRQTAIKPPADFKLATLCNYFGIEIEAQHDALADVRMNVRLAQAIQERACREEA